MLLVFAGLVDNTLFEAQVVALDKPLNVRGCEGGGEGIGGSEGGKGGVMMGASWNYSHLFCPKLYIFFVC